ncbi:hypothetical protein ACHAW6_014628 [Cyclotella cf. meneghiniana]
MEESNTEGQTSPQQPHSNEVCSAAGECERCPHRWRVSLETEDEQIRGEFESCQLYERRQRYDCTLFYDAESSEKITKNRSEYRPCRYTESDEQLRMLRMQLICLVIGIFSIRMVKRQKAKTASLFDQRRTRNQHHNSTTANGNNDTGTERRVKYSQLPKEDSMETIELTWNRGAGKVPKSPAPDLQTV